ncbi:hypothetical protein HXX76_009998 [Chlamydomonas incerta]|uniref:Uncharacterized protein n=1 Tax=Chlamydomonas incerta TaxID=51695 RepID=A0A835T211_CHLIN|nr:hypothetical protein HXX76_009998 [Chlamydomonas incerta]|eukprot:KAG2430475.1 hypothetical protein HXX76_009998 [Chlamydomonas incerta]
MPRSSVRACATSSAGPGHAKPAIEVFRAVAATAAVAGPIMVIYVRVEKIERLLARVAKELAEVANELAERCTDALEAPGEAQCIGRH